VKGCTLQLRVASRGYASGLLAVSLLFIATAAGLVWVSMGIVASDRWPIRWLEVNGTFQRVSAEQLRATLVPAIHANFFTVDVNALRGAAESLSWVESVTVRKQWPDTVWVTVAEFQPVAHWNRGQLIANDGKQFAVPEADELQGLPWLEGPDSQLHQVLTNWVEFNERLVPLGLEVDRLRLDRRGAWSMVLSNGTQVELGRDATAARLNTLLESWDELMSEQPVPPRDIDLRYTNGFAVLWPRQAADNSGTGG